MLKRVSLGVAVTVAVLGGFAGVYTSATPSPKPPAARQAAAEITCSVKWPGINPPDPIAPTRIQQTDPKVAPPKTQQMQLTQGLNATLRAEMTAPYASLPATKTCTGGDPLDVTWESSVNGKRLDDLWFLNSNTEDLEFYDSDPVGVRSWTGVVDPATAGGNVTFVNPPNIEVRFGSKAWRADFFQNPTGVGWTWVVEADYYNVKARKFIAWPGIALQPMYACNNTAIWRNLGPSVTTNRLGRISYTNAGLPNCSDGKFVRTRVTLPTTPSVWGATYHSGS